LEGCRLKDARLFPLRIVAEQDKRLANAGLMILLRIITARNNSHDHADEEFPLPWTLVASWTGFSRRQCFEWIARLAALGYLVPTQWRGCPPTACYRLVLARAKCAENRSLKRAGKCSLKRAGKCSHHIYSLPSGGRINKGDGKGEELATPSQETRGKVDRAASDAGRGMMTREQVAAALKEARLKGFNE